MIKIINLHLILPILIRTKVGHFSTSHKINKFFVILALKFYVANSSESIDKNGVQRRTSRRIAKAKYKEDTEKDFVHSFSDFSDNSDSGKQQKIKMQNKIRARKSRERKKKYTENLEQKVDILEKQVKYLTLELDKYKKIALKKGRFHLVILLL